MNEQRHLTWVAALTTFLTALTLSPLFVRSRAGSSPRSS